MYGSFCPRFLRITTELAGFAKPTRCFTRSILILNLRVQLPTIRCIAPSKPLSFSFSLCLQLLESRQKCVLKILSLEQPIPSTCGFDLLRVSQLSSHIQSGGYKPSQTLATIAALLWALSPHFHIFRTCHKTISPFALGLIRCSDWWRCGRPKFMMSLIMGMYGMLIQPALFVNALSNICTR